MNFILQDFVEPKVLGDSLHLHPVYHNPIHNPLDCSHYLFSRMGNTVGSHWCGFCCSFDCLYQNLCT